MRCWRNTPLSLAVPVGTVFRWTHTHRLFSHLHVSPWQNVMVVFPQSRLRTRNSSVTLRLKYSEQLSVLLLRYFGQPQWERRAPAEVVTVLGSAVGEHAVEIKGVDPAGNQQENSVLLSWIRDTGTFFRVVSCLQPVAATCFASWRRLMAVVYCAQFHLGWQCSQASLMVRLPSLPA